MHKRGHEAERPTGFCGSRGDSLVVIGEAGAAPDALRALRYVPALHVSHIPHPDGPIARPGAPPLLYLLGRCSALPGVAAIRLWLDELAREGGPPVVLLLPRTETSWCALLDHPQCIGILEAEPVPEAAEVERVIAAARADRSRRWRRDRRPVGRLLWTFSTAEAADVDRTWLLVASALIDFGEPAGELDHLGMAFTEALTNAVEHGNLELSSSLKDEADGMDRFFAERRRRLSDPRYAARKIRVSLDLLARRVRIRLRNQGPGFRVEETDPRTSLARTHPYGLGLLMIEGLVDEISIAADGRGITLTSRRPRTARRRAA